MTGHGSACVVLALLLGWMSPASRLDANSCKDVTVSFSGGFWGHDNCSTTSCGTSNCAAYADDEGSTHTSTCGCGGVAPTCCHVVLVSTNNGPFLPKKAGECGIEGCSAGTCILESPTESIRKAKCKAVTPPPG